MTQRIGIVGAGFIGRACAQLFIQAGYEVAISNSRGPQTLASTASGIAGCRIGSRDDAIAFGNSVLIAIPFSHYATLPADALAGKIVFDANNYYPERDGLIPALDQRQITTSELIARHLPRSRVVKVFNAILAGDLVTDARPTGSPQRRALPIAGDDAQAKQDTATLLDRIGYDFVDAGSLADSWRFERAKPAYCLPLNRAELRAALAAAERDQELPHNSWHRPAP